MSVRGPNGWSFDIPDNLVYIIGWFIVFAVVAAIVLGISFASHNKNLRAMACIDKGMIWDGGCYTEEGWQIHQGILISKDGSIHTKVGLRQGGTQ